MSKEEENEAILNYLFSLFLLLTIKKVVGSIVNWGVLIMIVVNESDSTGLCAYKAIGLGVVQNYLSVGCTVFGSQLHQHIWS